MSPEEKAEAVLTRARFRCDRHPALVREIAASIRAAEAPAYRRSREALREVLNTRDAWMAYLATDRPPGDPRAVPLESAYHAALAAARAALRDEEDGR